MLKTQKIKINKSDEVAIHYGFNPIQFPYVNLKDLTKRYYKNKEEK